jgi:hypothetical protein
MRRFSRRLHPPPKHVRINVRVRINADIRIFICPAASAGTAPGENTGNPGPTCIPSGFGRHLEVLLLPYMQDLGVGLGACVFLLSSVYFIVSLQVPVALNGVCRFSFSQLCGTDLGPVDFGALASHFHTVAIDNIPCMSTATHNQVRTQTGTLAATHILSPQFGLHERRNQTLDTPRPAGSSSSLTSCMNAVCGYCALLRLPRHSFFWKKR